MSPALHNFRSQGGDFSFCGQIAVADMHELAAAAITLAFLSGAMLPVMGVLRLGFLANFLSHPVISGSSRHRDY